MSNKRETIEDIFLDAIELPRQQRGAFLDQRCANDDELRAGVEELLHADDQAGDGEFLDTAMFSPPSSQPSSESAAAKPNDPTERFRILCSYRQGGLGEVLIAHDRDLDREVAVKQIKPNWREHQEARERFIREAKVTARLEHPGVVPVYAMGNWDDGGHYYAMRFIEGETMKDAIAHYHESSSDEDARDLLLRELLTRFVDVCNTIDYAHSKNVLHRDIKPSNVMVGGFGDTLVVDWGLAKVLDDPGDVSMTEYLAHAIERERQANSSSDSIHTRVGGAVGTPQYMSPEQASGNVKEISFRTDVYLLGATLYQILTGQPPHQGDSIKALLQSISTGAFRKPSELLSNVPPALESICLKAMELDSGDRYCSAGEIAGDVNRWMADQAVSVHHDTGAARVFRWMRHHPASMAASAVALLLMTVGGVFGTAALSQVRMQRIATKQSQENARIQAALKDQRRLEELGKNAGIADGLATREIQRGRFTSARDVLQSILVAIEPEPLLAEQASELRAKADRMNAVVEFYRLYNYLQEQNILSRDSKALLAGTRGLKILGVWEKPDWWTALPDEDLSPEQREQLRWDVYQQLMLMDAMLIKTVGVRLTGMGRLQSATAAIETARRLISTGAGKPEAEAAIVVSDRLDRFRVSEASRLYRSVAELRLGVGSRLLGSELGLTKNFADAHSLGVLCLIASIDYKFELIFGGYEGDDPLVSARNLFRRCAALRPGYYGAHLGLGQVEYIQAARDPNVRWEDLEPSVLAFSHCITLKPDLCFALNDRSNVYRFQARLITDDDRYDEDDRQRRVEERLRWSLADAQLAMSQYQHHPWVGWQTGFALAEMGETDRALGRWIHTAVDTFPLAEITDASFLQVDDLRGRAEISKWLGEGLNESRFSDPLSAWTALAGIRLNQLRFEEAAQAIEHAIQYDESNVQARAMRGMIRLRQQQFESAEIDFDFVLQESPNEAWGNWGKGSCLEARQEYEQAIDFYERSRQNVLSGENRAAAMLAKARAQAMLGQYEPAGDAVLKAIEVEPACHVLSVARPLARYLRDLRNAKSGGERAQQKIDALTSFLKSLAAMPRGTRIEMMPESESDSPAQASLLGGEFELKSLRYWDLSFESLEANARRSENEDAAIVRLTSDQPHSGSQALRIGAGSKVLMSQRFSLITGTTYEVSVWVRAEDLQSESGRLVGADGATWIEFGEGSYGWRRATGQFTFTPSGGGVPVERGAIAESELRIESAGQGTIWLDDLVIQSVAPQP